MKKGQIVELKDEFKGPRDMRSGGFGMYEIVKVMRVNVVAVNLGTFAYHTLRISELKIKK